MTTTIAEPVFQTCWSLGCLGAGFRKHLVQGPGFKLSGLESQSLEPLPHKSLGSRAWPHPPSPKPEAVLPESKKHRFARRRAAEAFAGKQGPVLMGLSESIQVQET